MSVLKVRCVRYTVTLSQVVKREQLCISPPIEVHTQLISHDAALCTRSLSFQAVGDNASTNGLCILMRTFGSRHMWVFETGY